MLVIMAQYYDEYFREYLETIRDFYRNKIAKEKNFIILQTPLITYCAIFCFSAFEDNEGPGGGDLL